MADLETPVFRERRQSSSIEGVGDQRQAIARPLIWWPFIDLMAPIGMRHQMRDELVSPVDQNIRCPSTSSQF